MKDLVTREFERLLGGQLKITPCGKTRGLSFLLLGLYNLYECVFNDFRFILMCHKKKTVYTPGTVSAHMAQIQAATGLPVVFATTEMPSYKRARFLEKHIPFIIPGKQMYLPFAGLLLTENGSPAPKEFDSLGNLAQILILARLMKRFSDPLSIGAACSMIRYSRISVIRAFDELEHFQLARRCPATKHLEFMTDHEHLWKKALPLLHNPKRRVIGLEKLPQGLPVYESGINALSKHSMLSPDPQMEYAVEAKAFNKLGIKPECPLEDAPVLLELWNYAPAIIGGDDIDPFSLYLTLKDNPDDRVQIALETMLKEFL